MSDGDLKYKFFSITAREKIPSGYNVKQSILVLNTECCAFRRKQGYSHSTKSDIYYRSAHGGHVADTPHAVMEAYVLQMLGS